MLRHGPLQYVDDLGPIVVAVTPYVAARVNRDDPPPKLATLHARDVWTQVNGSRLADRHTLVLSRRRPLTDRDSERECLGCSTGRYGEARIAGACCGVV
jgi:hypothetical protein